MILTEELDKLNKFSADELKELQKNKLKQRVAYHYLNNLTYRKMLDNLNLKPGDINTLNDIKKLPIIDKHHIIDNHPFLSVHPHDIIRYYQTSGTTGQPKLIPYNVYDRDRAANLKARGFLLGGVKEYDKLLAVMAYGPWASGLMSQQAGEYIGLTIAGDAKLDTKWHVWAVQTHKPDYMVCLPAFLPRFCEVAKEQNVDPATLSLKRIFVCGDMSTEKFKNHFERAFNAEIRDLYCCTEFGCIAAECEKGKLHYWADDFYIEVIDPKTKKALETGKVGELVITGLSKEAIPLIRYNTHDLGFLSKEKCKCGREFPIMSHIFGRSDNMITISGANIFPIQIEAAISSVPEITNMYNFIVTQKDFKDQITLKVEVKHGVEKSDTLKEKIIRALVEIAPEVDYVINQSKTAHMPEIILLNHGELFQGSLKMKKIFDERKRVELVI